MKIKANILETKLINIAKKHTLLRKLARKIIYFKNYVIFKIRTFGISIDEKTVIFYAYAGKSYSCSPKTIYECMIQDEKYRDFNFIWAFNKPENYKFLENNINTKVIPYGGKEYEKSLAKAKYWFFNFKVEDHIYPNKNQMYIQLWHGTPLKKLGYDLKGSYNALNSDKETYSKYKIDAKKYKYIISPSKFASEKFATAWNLIETNQMHKILETGYPRNDFLYNYKQSDVENIKCKINIPKNKKVILYAPTWRDDQHKSGVGYTYKTEVDFKMLKEMLKDDYVILFRAHYLVANSFDFYKYKDFIYNVSNIDDINELYIISDILITDYSSVFFDYANLKRPIIFYMYDFEKYKDELRGFYIDVSELPGKITKTEKQLVQAIKETTNFEYDEKYQKFNQKFNYLDDGQVAKKVINKILE